MISLPGSATASPSSTSQEPNQQGSSELSEDLFLFFTSTKKKMCSFWWKNIWWKRKNITEGYKIKSKCLLSPISYFLEITILNLLCV